MEYAVNDNTVELIVVSLAELLRIGAHGVEGDDDVAVEDIILIVVEGDDVGVIVVTQILTVDLQDLLVIDKHVAYLTDLTAMGCRHA